ncbi:MAG: DUF1573 domain-containing protein [Planctomycetaceae bacterium]|jgi:hypothetical protein
MSSESIRKCLAFTGLVVLILGLFPLVSWFRGEPIFPDVEDQFLRQPTVKVAPSESGPWPKAVVERAEFRFGQLFEGEEATVSTQIQNRGDAPLMLAPGKAVCDCEFVDFPLDPIPVGESAQIQITWRPRPGSESFEKFVIINTNDPKQQEIRLAILGSALQAVLKSPQDDWDVPEVLENRPTEFVGSLMSPLKEDFSIESIDPGDAPIDVRVERVARVNAETPQGERPGNRLIITLRPEMPRGPFRYPIRVITNIPALRGQTLPANLPGQEVMLYLTGTRRGPFRFLGKGWYADRNTLSLGTFSAQSGMAVKLLLFCEDDSVPDLQVLEIRTNDPELQFSYRRDDAFRGKGLKFDIDVAIPPAGSPRVRKGLDAAKIWIKTSHPQFEEVELLCDFTAI